jgi:hypothetical protein
MLTTFIVGPLVGGYLTSVNRRYAFAASAAMVLVGWGVVGTQVKETLPPENRKKAAAAASEIESDESAAGSMSSKESGGSMFTLSDSHPLSFLRLMGPQATTQMRTLTWLHALGGTFVIVSFQQSCCICVPVVVLWYTYIKY